MEETKEDRIEYKIYRIVCNETGEIYFGKTIRTLQERLRLHISKLNCTSRQIILRSNYGIEQINSTFDEEESVRLERYYIETFECVNERVPGRLEKEWREENKEELKQKNKEWNELNPEYMKEYYEEHKEEISEKRKEQYTCECGSIFTICNKARHEKTQKHINYINSKK